jgi:hypothetical protein
VPEPSDIDRDLQRLEAELKKLEAEYNMFFSGRLPKPPVESRSRVEALVKQYDRNAIQNYGDKFRFSTLQFRFAALADLWDRAMRAREEGRAGPFAHIQAEQQPKHPEDRILHVASFHDPIGEGDKLRELYDSLAEARREAGEPAIPFHKFAELVATQVARLRTGADAPVAFRVAVKSGKVTFTARALTGARQEGAATDDE